MMDERSQNQKETLCAQRRQWSPSWKQGTRRGAERVSTGRAECRCGRRGLFRFCFLRALTEPLQYVAGFY